MKSFFKKIIVAIITWEAKMVLKKYKPQIVGVTGSVGKTSSKDAIYTVFKTTFKVRKSDKSFNSEIGIPLTILGCQNAWSDLGQWLINIFSGLKLIVFKSKYPKWLVLEIGADRPGDIRGVCEWLKPDVSVITRFGKVPVHVEYFSSPEQVMEEKSHLALATKTEGTVILNADDEDVIALYNKVKAKVLSFGMEGAADVVASNYNILYDAEKTYVPTGITFKIEYGGSSVPVTIKNALGRAHIYPVLSAVAAGISQNLNLVTISQGLEHHETPPGRMKIIEGKKNTVIIDDTYNSSPVALNEALEAFKSLQKNRYKIAVLGDMLEIGKYTVEEHKKIGKKASEIADILITVGLRSRHIAEGALEGGMSEKNIFQYDKSQEAGKFLSEILEEGDAVLVKGSQGTRMEKVIEQIMAHPENKEKLLVRQDSHWINR